MYINKLFNHEKELISHLFDFIKSKYKNKELYEELKQLTINHSYRPYDKNRDTLIKNLDYFCAEDIMSCMHQKWFNGKGLPKTIFDLAIKRLITLHVFLSVNLPNSRNDYLMFNDALIEYLIDKNALDNLFFGFSYIIDKYKESVFKIEVQDESEDLNLGTGFLFSYRDNKQDCYSIILTCKHVVENKNILAVRSDSGIEYEFEPPIISSKFDLAIIPLVKDVELSCFRFSFEDNLLEEIITIGYPLVARAQKRYQIINTGQINSYIVDQGYNEVFLISAKSNPGNSGSPVIDSMGLVHGIVTDIFAHQHDIPIKGETITVTSDILPYYAAIPSKNIVEFINEEYLTKKKNNS